MLATLVALTLPVLPQSQSAPSEDVLGRPPTSVKEMDLGNGGAGPTSPFPGLPPAMARGGPDLDDVQVSSPDPRNQNEMVIRVNPTDRNHLIGGANDNRNGNYTTAFYASTDGGVSWSEFLYSPGEFPSAGDPAAAFGPNGEVFLCTLEFSGSSAIYVGESFDGGLTVPSWTRAVGDPGTIEDKQYMVCDQTDSALSGVLYVTWTRFAAGNPIMCMASGTNGALWSHPRQVSDGSNCQGSNPVVGPNGELYVTFYNFSDGMMYVDKSLDAGLTWGTDVAIGPSNSTLPRSNFRHFTFPTSDVDVSGGPHDGTLYVAFTTYVAADSSTDVVLYKSVDGGATFSGPVKVANSGDSSEFFPWLDVDSNGNVNITFYDRRDDPNDRVIGFYAARSSDGGATFTNHRVHDISFDTFTYGDGSFIGDYTGLAASDRTLHPLWTDGRNATNDTYTSRVQLDFYGDTEQLPASTGGDVNFTLNAGPNLAGSNYRLLGSFSGTSPGLVFGSGVDLPLNFDLYFLYILKHANDANHQNFAGVLDATGSAAPKLTSGGPIPANLVGLQLDFAAMVTMGGSVLWASNPAHVEIVP